MRMKKKLQKIMQLEADLANANAKLSTENNQENDLSNNWQINQELAEFKGLYDYFDLGHIWRDDWTRKDFVPTNVFSVDFNLDNNHNYYFQLVSTPVSYKINANNLKNIVDININENLDLAKQTQELYEKLW